MLFGIAIRGWMLMAGGLTGLALVVFQVLQGKRIIRFKGPLHLKVHKAVAAALLAVSIVHAIAALAFLGYL